MADPNLRYLRAFARSSMGPLGGLVLLLIFASAAFSEVDRTLFNSRLIAQVLHHPNALNATVILHPPSAAHPLGTDSMGRDVLARIIYGSSVSIRVALLAVMLSGVVGSIVGLVAGFYGGVVDMVVMRVVDILLAFPGIILALLFVGFIGPGLTNVIIALSLRSWVNYARVIRSEALRLRDSDFVTAARAAGCSDLRIIFGHVLPNAISPILVQASMGLGAMVLAEASLSFLGLGVMPPTPSWGRMLSEGQTHIRSAWWLSVFPGSMIFLSVMGANLFGDAVRDMLDPRAYTMKARAVVVRGVRNRQGQE